MQQILIVTSVNDEHADFVSQELLKMDVGVLRINTETFIEESLYAFEWNSEGKITNQTLRLLEGKNQNIKVVWWRLPGAYQPSKKLINKNAIDYAVLETQEIIDSIESLFPNAKWINKYEGILRSFHRIHQIQSAQKVKLTIPPTLVTNSFEEAKKFLLSNGSCIIKTLLCRHFVKDEVEHTCYTRSIDIDTLLKFKETVQFAPVYFQKKIEKYAEYRITIIGEKTFVCRIDAKHLNSDAQLDWRMAEPSELIHTPDTIPEDFILKIRKMMKMFDLSFAAVDAILGSDGVYYFLEINPTGQWIWIELATGLPMVKAFTDLIISYMFE